MPLQNGEGRGNGCLAIWTGVGVDAAEDEDGDGNGDVRVVDEVSEALLNTAREIPSASSGIAGGCRNRFDGNVDRKGAHRF